MMIEYAKASSMSEEFHDWLNDCPVEWYRKEDDGKGSAVYLFIEPDIDEVLE